MISRVKGTLITRDLNRIEVETSGGVVYEIEVPLTVLERIPEEGNRVEIRTVHLVREDSATLYGFITSQERELFRRLMGAKGVGAKVALAMLSTYSAPRLAQALVEKDIVALTQVSGVGKKTAERIVLDLSDRVQDLAVAAPTGGTRVPGAEAAVAALVALGLSFVEADQAVRRALEDGKPASSDELIRKALSFK